MTTLSANKQRAYEGGDINEFSMAVDIVYEGSAVGVVDATADAQPLADGNKFVGFARAKADNSGGSAGDIRVQVYTRGRIQLPVSGAVDTDIGMPVYATDDDAFQFVATSAVFVGYVWRFVSAGNVIVEFDATSFVDPYAGWIHETTAINKSVDSEDSGKCFWVTADAKTLTLPAVAVGVHNVRVVNAGAFGDQLVTIDLDGNDSLESADITAADGKGLLNTKATARRGDGLILSMVDAVGYTAHNKIGIWAIEG